jgi:hypothetical protein
MLTAQGCPLNKQTGLSASWPLFSGAPGGRALGGTEASPIQQTRIEPIVDRMADLDFFEIRMLGI